MIRRLIVMLVLLAAPVAVRPATAVEAPVGERSDLTLDPHGLARLRIENSRGRVLLKPSRDGQLHLTAIKLVRAGTSERTRQYLRETTVETRREGDRYVVIVHYPPRIDIQVNFWELFRHMDHDDSVMPRLEVQIVCEVPHAVAPDLQTVSGDIESDGIGAPQLLRATSGDVTVSHANGALDIHTVSGDITLEDVARVRLHTTSGDVVAHDVRGAFDGETTSGDLSLTDVRDSVRIGTTSGDVEVGSAPSGIDASTVSGAIVVRDASGHITVQTSSGDVEVSAHAPLRGVSAGTSSGEVKLQLAQGTDANLDLASSSGTLSCQAPVRMLDHGRNSLRAELGRGGPLIKVRTASGDIQVSSGGR